MPKTAFLDTNIYIHYQIFDQIKWPEILHTSKVMIVIPPVTIRELNRLKDLNLGTRVRKRAGKVPAGKG